MKNLRKDTGILVDEAEIYDGISKLLNKAVGNVTSKIKLPVYPSRKRSKKKPKDTAPNAEGDDDGN